MSESNSSKRRKTNIFIATNVCCNLRCSYCYEDKSSTKTFDVALTKERLKRVLSTPNYDEVIINLHGGEPFMVFDKIKDLIEWTINQNFPQRFVFFATTNGTLIHDDIKRWVEKHKRYIILGLSLDGTRDMQNANRSNSYDSIDPEFFARTWPHQSVKMTVSPATISTLSDGIKHLHNLGFNDIRCNLAEMVSWNDSLLPVFERELNKLKHFYKENPELKRASIIDVRLINILPDFPLRKWCGIGEMNALDIESDNRYPCHLMFPSVCGVEKSEKSLEYDFTNIETLISDECRDCKFLKICPTCYGSNFIARGKFCNRDMQMCKFNKIRFRIVAELEYENIMEDKRNMDLLSPEERLSALKKLEALETLIPLLQ